MHSSILVFSNGGTKLPQIESFSCEIMSVNPHIDYFGDNNSTEWVGSEGGAKVISELLPAALFEYKNDTIIVKGTGSDAYKEWLLNYLDKEAEWKKMMIKTGTPGMATYWLQKKNIITEPESLEDYYETELIFCVIFKGAKFFYNYLDFIEHIALSGADHYKLIGSFDYHF